MVARDASVDELYTAARAGDRRALGRLLTLVERGGSEAETIGELANPDAGAAHIVGITGAPGAGKSTLTGRLVTLLAEAGRRPAVLAVDPSSPLTGGAILGDRIRMADSKGGRAFIRSMATRGHSGGLALAVPLAVRLFDAMGHDPVIIETVGVGQVEVDVVAAADTAVVVMTPGMGDAVQANKAGLLEVADVFVVNKADRPGADDVRRDLDLMLDLSHLTGQDDQDGRDGYRPPIVMCSALEGHRRGRGVGRGGRPPRPARSDRSAAGPPPPPDPDRGPGPYDPDVGIAGRRGYELRDGQRAGGHGRGRGAVAHRGQRQAVGPPARPALSPRPASSAAADVGPASTRRIGAAAKLLGLPDEVLRVLGRLDDDQLTNLAAAARQEQARRAVERGDLDEIIAQAFETGFGNDGLAHLPWVEGTVVVCPGGLVWSSRTSHTCRFVNVDDTWVWDSHDLIREDKRSTPGSRDGFRAVALLPVLERMALDVVSGRARQGQHSVDRVVSFEVRSGELVEVAQRDLSRRSMH